MVGKRRSRDSAPISPKRTRTVVGALMFMLVSDITCTVLVFLAKHHWCKHDYCPDSIHAFFDLFRTFRLEEDAVDVIALTAIRMLIMALGPYIAIKAGKPDTIEEDVYMKKQDMKGFSVNSSETEPLLSNKNGDDDGIKLINGKRHKKASMFGDWCHISPIVRKRLCVAVFFFMLTSAQAYVGVKCVIFEFGDSTILAVLMCSSVLWINAELYLAKTLIDALTSEPGHLIKDLHVHPLHFVPKLPLHTCDACSNKIRTAAYRCKICDFDCCLQCFAKKKRSDRAEGVVRGDKGVKSIKEISNLSYAQRGLKLCAPHWKYIVVALLCLLANNMANLFLPNYNGKIMDRIIAGDRHGFQKDVLLYIYLSIGTGFFGAVRQFMFRLVGTKLANKVRNDLFSRVIYQDTAFFDGARTGDLISRLSGDVGAMTQPFRTMIGTVLANVITLVGGIVFCFHTSWRLSMLAFVTIAPVMYLTDQYAVWSRKLMYEYFSALGDANAKASEALTNVRTVKAFSTEKIENSGYKKSTAEALHKAITDAIGSAATASFTNYLDLGGTVLILWYGGSLAMAGRATVGTLVAFRIYWGMINNAYKSLMNVLSGFTRAGGAAQRVLSLLDSCPDIDPDVGKELTDIKGHISIRNVEFAYQMRPNEKVLKGVSLDIRPGQVCAIVGRSGGGKSTLVHLMMRFYDPNAGDIFIDGDNLKEVNLRSYHEQCGLVAQDTQLFACSIRENICYGLEKEFESGKLTMADIVKAAEDANAHEFISKFEDGYETKAGERGVRLSGGQKQRLSLARIFLRKPRLLFLDEATSALDSESESEVQLALDRLIAQKDVTIILVAHRLSTVMNADKIIVLDKGTIAEEGTHSELLQVNGIYSKLVSKQLAKQSNQLNTDGEADNVDSLLQDEEGNNSENPEKSK
eukprot:m.100707 g.100707  ORF g.100707 m.100707 type:complete len:916 (-) comp13720_c0_seq5:44-2791(-)